MKMTDTLSLARGLAISGKLQKEETQRTQRSAAASQNVLLFGAAKTIARPLQFGDTFSKGTQRANKPASPADKPQEPMSWEKDILPTLQNAGMTNAITLFQSARELAKSMGHREVTALHLLQRELETASKVFGQKPEQVSGTGLEAFVYDSLIPMRYTTHKDEVITHPRAMVGTLQKMATQLESDLKAGKKFNGIVKKAPKAEGQPSQDPPFSPAILQLIDNLLKVDFPDAEKRAMIRLKGMEANRRKELSESIQKLETQLENCPPAEKESLSKALQEDKERLATLGETLKKEAMNRLTSQNEFTMMGIFFSEGLYDKWRAQPEIHEARKIHAPLMASVAERSGKGFLPIDADTLNETAARLGAGPDEQFILNGLIGSINKSFERGETGPLQQLKSLAPIYAETDWNALRKKKINLDSARRILAKDPVIPQEVRDGILAYLRKGNTQGWTQAPLLLLEGGGENDLLRARICENLAKILGVKSFDFTVPDMSHYGGHDAAHGLVRDGSPAVKAMLKSGSAHTLVRLKEIERFIMQSSMGENFFNAVATPADRKKFYEAHLAVDTDLSPLIWVAETGPSQQYGWNHEFWKRRVGDGRQVFNLNVDHAYTQPERLRVLKEVLLPKVKKEFGLNAGLVKIDEAALERLAADYPFSARLDEMERNLSNIYTVAAARLSDPKPAGIPRRVVHVTAENLPEFIEKLPFTEKQIQVAKQPKVGVAHILATFGNIDAGVCHEIFAVPLAVTHKDGELKFRTGKVFGPVGETYQDSFEKLATYLEKANYERLKTDPNAYILNMDTTGPTEGPSAGAANTTAMISAITGIPYNHKVAMTGTLNVDGSIGPIGGTDIKIMMGAKRAGTIEKVLVPKDNYSQLIAEKRRHPGLFDGIEIVPVETIDQVLRHALVDYDALHKPHPDWKPKSESKKETKAKSEVDKSEWRD